MIRSKIAHNSTRRARSYRGKEENDKRPEGKKERGSWAGEGGRNMGAEREWEQRKEREMERGGDDCKTEEKQGDFEHVQRARPRDFL